MLESRISNERRPKYIIPFQISKEQCKKAYSSYTRKYIFAPGQLKKSKYINSFRGIYMPYWTYDIEQNGSVCIPAKFSKKKDHCLYVDYYEITIPIKAAYKGLSFDASSSFDDSISNYIAPYDVNGVKEFVPSILSGFYADTQDVESRTYVYDAKDLAFNTSFDKVAKDPVFKGLEIEKDKIIRDRNFNTECKSAEISLFPVWFMSYRNKDRVAYAVVNGQTGKVSADMPVDMAKYVISSFILMIPIFLLFELFLPATPMFMLSAASVLAIIMQFIYYKELTAIIRKKTRTHDRGYIAANKKRRKEKKNELTESKGAPVFLLSFITVLTGLIVRLIDPASDLFYYITAVLILVAVVMNAIGLIGRHNILTTRKLPQFNRHGGDDNA